MTPTDSNEGLRPRLTIAFFLGLFVVSMGVVPFVGRDFFPAVDAGIIRLHVVTRAGTRIEQADAAFGQVEDSIRQIVPKAELKLIIDNIGLPVGGVNLAYSDSATIGSTDGEIQVALSTGQKTPAQDRDLGGVSDDIQKIIEQYTPKLPWYKDVIPAKLTHHDIVELASRLPALRERFSCAAVREYPQLAAQYDFLALIVEDCSHRLPCKVSEACQREAAFALLSLEKHGDLLPDDAPGIGLTDNQAMVATVLHKHREALRACPRSYLFRWPAESVDFGRMVLDRLHDRMAKFRLLSLGRNRDNRSFGSTEQILGDESYFPVNVEVSQFVEV